MNWLLSRPLRSFVALAAFASLLLNVALVVPSLYMLQVFDRVFASRSLETLVMLSLFALLALGLAGAMDRARGLLLAGAGRALEDALAPPALAATLAEAAQGRPGGGAATLLPDIARLRNFLASPAVQALFDAPWLPLYLLAIFALHPALGLTALLAAAALFTLGLVSERLIRADAQAASAGSRDAGHWIDALTRHAELLQGMRMHEAALATWQRSHGQAQQAQARLAATQATLAALGRSLRQGVQVGMLGLGAWLVVAHQASPGIMIAATLLVGRALQPVEHLVAGWKSLVDVRAAWQRLRHAPVDDPARAPLPLPAWRGSLSLERVTLLAGPRRALVKGVSLDLAPGQCLGLVGPSGSGKTTLLRLMLGLREPDAGEVRLDGVALAHWPAEQLAGAVGYLPQDVQLFEGTVAQNIARLGPVDAPAVMAAAQLAGVHELITRLPQAYDTELGVAGALLSGGQRQRVALARAVYGRPALVVLDEPDANLDSDGDAALAATLAGLKAQGTTVVLVSHRPAVMRHADTLALLRDGALECLGPRDEVLARLAGGAVRPLRRPAAAAATTTLTPLNQGAEA